MSLTIAYPLAFALAGAIVYLLCVPPGPARRAAIGELARLACFAGLLWLVYVLIGRAVHLP